MASMTTRLANNFASALKDGDAESELPASQFLVSEMGPPTTPT